MKSICLTISILSIALAFSACNKDNTTAPNSANVMFVNACNGSANIDTKVNGTKLSAGSNLAYFASSGYQSVTAGTGVGIDFLVTALGTSLSNGTANFSAGSNYSVFAGGIITAPTFVVTSDDVSAPTSGNAKVRFINLSSDALNESFYLGSSNQKLDSNITMSAYTPYFEVAAGSAKVLVQDPLQPLNLAVINSQTFVAGKIYTIMLSGTASGSGAAVLTLTVINNN